MLKSALLGIYLALVEGLACFNDLAIPAVSLALTGRSNHADQALTEEPDKRFPPHGKLLP